MRYSRALPLALVLAVLPLSAVNAQFGGMPGMPGAPRIPDPDAWSAWNARSARNGVGVRCACAGAATRVPAVAGLPGRDVQARTGPPGCRQRRLPREAACKLFKAFTAAEAKFVKGLEDNSATCGVPADVIKQVKAGHSKAVQTAKNVCDAAAQGPRPAGPTLSDALGNAHGSRRLLLTRPGDLRHLDG